MAWTADSTCLMGLDLALKWAQNRNDADLVRCAADVAHDCLDRATCPRRAQCDRAIATINGWLDEVEQQAKPSRNN